MRLFRTVLAGALLLALTSCMAVSSVAVDPGPLFTCCEEADTNRDYQPGDTMTLHWTGPPATPGTAQSTHEFDLNAHLTGPYAAVGDLKQDNGKGASSTYSAAPIHRSGQSAEPPVSVILIPSTAVPGYYNLATSVSGPGYGVSSGSVIRVVART